MERRNGDFIFSSNIQFNVMLFMLSYSFITILTICYILPIIVLGILLLYYRIKLQGYMFKHPFEKQIKFRYPGTLFDKSFMSDPEFNKMRIKAKYIYILFCIFMLSSVLL